MKLTTVLSSVLLPALLVTAQGEVEPSCNNNSGGPSDATTERITNDFIGRYAGDGFMRLAPGELTCLKCEGAEVSATNTCAVNYECTADAIRELMGNFGAGQDGCGGPLDTGPGAEAGCMALIYASEAYYDDNCAFTCS